MLYLLHHSHPQPPQHMCVDGNGCPSPQTQMTLFEIAAAMGNPGIMAALAEAAPPSADDALQARGERGGGVSVCAGVYVCVCVQMRARVYVMTMW
jgi:hypothetical protein